MYFFQCNNRDDSSLKFLGFTSDNLAKFFAIAFDLNPISFSVAALILLIFGFLFYNINFWIHYIYINGRK